MSEIGPPSKPVTPMSTLEDQLRAFGLNTESPPNAAAWQAFIEHVRQAEEANYHRSELFSTLSDPDFENIIIYNERGRILDTNRNASQSNGYNPTELIGQEIFVLFAPSSYDTIRQIITSPQTSTREVELQRNNGARFTGEVRGKTVHFAGQTIRGLLTRNISDRKYIERELENQLRETLLLNRVIGAVTSTLELQAVLQSLCQEVAKAFDLPSVAFALLDDEEKNLRIVAEFLDESQPPAYGTIISIATNPTTQYALTHKTPVLILNTQTDPRYAPLRQVAQHRGTVTVLIVPMLWRGKVIGTLGLNTTVERHFTDAEIQLAQQVAAAASQALENAQLYEALQQELAERKRTEIELAKARDEALEANRLQSELVAKVSHELRTPLNAILGYAEMLNLGVYGPVSLRQQDVTHNIMNRTEELISFVNDLLDQAQLEAGGFILMPRPFAPHQLSEHMLEVMGLMAQNKNLRLTAAVAPDLPPALIGDLDRLHQIIANLVSNAIKFTEIGHIHLHIFRYDETRWAFSVADTGRGIPLEAQSYIFDAFRQTSYSMTRQYSGVGLGLSIVKQLATLMNGTIHLESVENQGSTFTIIFPLITTLKAS